MAEDSAYAEQFRRAIEDFWSVRTRQGVRAGQHLDKLAELVGDIFVDEGFAEGNVLRRRQLELSGYYRSEKRWDLLVVYKNVLAAAIEFKSQVGSVGKNINNRVEEAVGSATDVGAAHREGRFGIVRPWLGYLLLLEDTPEIRKPVSSSEPFFSVEEVFRETSYKDRYEIFCRRLVEERLYDAACFVTLKQDTADPLEEPASDLTFTAFASAIKERAKALAALREEL
jgi:Restriction endonuclease XhoI